MSHTATPVRRATSPPAGFTLKVYPEGALLPIFADRPSPAPTVSRPCGTGGRPDELADAAANSPSGLALEVSPHPATVGIARLAASAPKEAEGKEVEYFRLPVRSVLNRVDSRRVGFPWSINPYRGCEFGCQYCYARYTHEYMELDPTEFETKIYVKDQAARLLRRDLTAEKVVGRHIAIGTATDPYQPAERRFGVTRAILETLFEFSRELPGGGGLSLSITTKSNLVLRDVALLQELSRGNRLHVNLSVTTLNPRLARVLEPRAPRPDQRLETVRQLNEAGVSAGVFVCPVLPGITDKPEALEALVAAAARARARYLCANVVFLMPSSQKKFFPFLEQKFPRLVKQYRKWYTRRGYAPEDYRRKISALMGQLRARYHLSGRWPDDPQGPNYSALAQPLAARPQLALPFRASPSLPEHRNTTSPQ